MKKCVSTALKSSGTLAEAIESKSTDGAASSVVQKNEKQSCQSFSLRGYVADMRIKNPKACNPFDNIEVECSNMYRDQRLNVERNSLNLFNPVLGKISSVEHRAVGGDTNKAPSEIILLDGSENGIAGDTNKAPSEIIVLDGGENGIPGDTNKAPSEIIALDGGENGIAGDTNKAPSEIITLDGSENGIAGDTNKAPSGIIVLDGSENGIAGDTNKAPTGIIVLDGSESEGVNETTRSQKELTRVREKASAGKSVATYSLEQIEIRPCLDKGKEVIIEIQDNGEEFVKQHQETRKATGESSRPLGDIEVEDNDQTAHALEPSEKFSTGGGYVQNVLDYLNTRIGRTTDIMRNQHQEIRKISSASTLDISPSLSCPGIEGNQKVDNEGISVKSHRKRKGTIDALANNNVSALKLRKQMEMSKTSCEIIDLESPSFSIDGGTRPVTIANTNHGQEFVTPFEAGNTKRSLSFSAYADSTSRKYAKATGESFRPRGDELKGPADKSNTGATPQVQNMLNLADQRMGDTNKAPSEIIVFDGGENGIAGDTNKAPSEIIVLDGSEIGIGGDTNEAPTGIIVLDDSETDGVIETTQSQKELTRVRENASAGKSVATYSLEKIEKRPCLDKGKEVIIEIQDNGEEFVKQHQETRKATGESSRPLGDIEVEDNDQTAHALEPSEKFNKCPPYVQNVLDYLNTRIGRTTDIMRNRHQEIRKISSASTLDISPSLSCPRIEGNQVDNEGISVRSHRKRKGTVDALANNNVSALKLRKQMEMSKTSCEIIDLESPSFSIDGGTRPVTIATTNHGQEFVTPFEAGNTKRSLSFSAYADSTSRKYAKATGESFRPRGDELKGPADKSNTGATPQVQNMLNLADQRMGRPLNPIKQPCLINRNPADFSVPDPENIYMK